MNEMPYSDPSREPVEKIDRTWDILCHLAALLGFVVPFGNIIGPLLVWLLKKNSVSSVELHGKEALNFQISMTIYTVIAGLTIIIMIGIFLLPVIIVANLVLTIIAAIKASNGELYRYPVSIRFVE
jgi:uncharacterized protein